MNKIIENFLKIHIGEYELNRLEPEEAFEHFVNRCIVNKYSADRFDPTVVMTDPGEKGLDGVAILVNERLISDMEGLHNVLSADKPLAIRFVFIQSKTSEKFSGSEIGDFIYGVKAFFEDKDNRPKTNEKMERLISIKDELYNNSLLFDGFPIVDLYFVSCGKWNEDNGLSDRIDIDLKPLRNSSDFSSVNFYPYDSDKLILTFQELKKKVVRSFPMERRITFPAMDGVGQSFLGIVKCKDFVELLRDSDGRMLTNIFEDNVRDFQGYNIVNSEIMGTLKDSADQNRFALLNNGVTIVSKRVEQKGDKIELFDYQIVNGCQTSYVLHDHSALLTDASYIVLKIIEVSDENVSDRVIYTTNRQTEVKAEAFAASKPFHKELQLTYDSIDMAYRLYYERRSKQYDLKDDVSKNKIVTLATQISAYLAVFLHEPHSTHRYYGELLETYKNKIFLDEDYREVYYVASYLVYYIDESFKVGKIPRKYRQFRYHLACAVKALVVGNEICAGKKRKQQKEFEKLFALIKDTDALDRHINTAISCLDEALQSCDDIAQKERHRSVKVTKDMLGNIETVVKTQSKKNFLQIGEIVHCVVNSMTQSYVFVKIRTDDTRNYGRIHISKLAKYFVHSTNGEVRLAEEFQAKIIGDFIEDSHGWELSKRDV